MPSKFIVYALIDPRDDQIRYVGKTTTGFRRPSEHKLHCYLKNERTPKANWIRELLVLGLCYRIVALEHCADADALCIREVFWIKKLREEECDLTNVTDGGEGAVGRVYKPSRKTIEKIRKANTGKKRTEEFKRRMSELATASPEARAKKATFKGRRHTEKTKRKIGAASRLVVRPRGYKRPAEVNEKIRASWIVRKREKRFKQKQTPATRRRMRKAQRLRRMREWLGL